MRSKKSVLVVAQGIDGWHCIAGAYLNCYAEDQLDFTCLVEQTFPLEPLVTEIMAEDNLDPSCTEGRIYSNLPPAAAYDFVLVFQWEGQPLPSLAGLSFGRKMRTLMPVVEVGADNPLRVAYLRQCREKIKKRILKFIGQEFLSVASYATN